MNSFFDIRLLLGVKDKLATKEDFNNNFMCEFKVDEDQLALENRLIQYYKETEHCDNKHAKHRWKEFKRWAIGYSEKEINQAKKAVNNRGV